jgi:hypothetical protein
MELHLEEISQAVAWGARGDPARSGRWHASAKLKLPANIS